MKKIFITTMVMFVCAWSFFALPATAMADNNCLQWSQSICRDHVRHSISRAPLATPPPVRDRPSRIRSGTVASAPRSLVVPGRKCRTCIPTACRSAGPMPQWRRSERPRLHLPVDRPTGEPRHDRSRRRRPADAGVRRQGRRRRLFTRPAGRARLPRRRGQLSL